MKKYIGFIVSMIVYMVAGAFMGMRLGLILDHYDFFIGICLFYLIFMVGIYLQLSIHEAGHMLFGILSGYKFQSYRVGSHIWVKQNGKILHKKYSLAGTAGQCILSLGETRKYFMYNLGGVLINMIVSIIAIGLSYIFKNELVTISLYIFGLSGIALALTNGIPLTMGGVDNDGMNIYHLSKNASSREAFYNQLLVQEKINDGVRIKDMDDAYLTYDEKALDDPLVAAIKISKYQKYLDQHDIETAEKIIKELKEPQVNLLGIHKSLMENDENLIHYLKDEPFTLSKALKNFNKSMKNYPGVIRSNYIYALVEGKDPSQYEKQLQDSFETYPYRSEIETEVALLELVKQHQKGLSE